MITAKSHVLNYNVHVPDHARLPTVLDSENHRKSVYFNHFQSHVRYILPGVSLQFIDAFLQLPCLHYAVLCLSASNLSMLNVQVQSRIIAGTDNSRQSVFSPLVNTLHHKYAGKYHDQALWHCRNARPDELKHQAPAFLAAYILLAYYHHASTNHLRFRLAVWDSVRFVVQNKTKIMASPSANGNEALQMWYRLCASHRPAKPPALLLEGEGTSSFGPNLFSDGYNEAVDNHGLYLNCIMGMGVDDLIYDILIKTMEIRTKFVVFRCVADSCHVSELSSGISSLAHEVMNKMLGRPCDPDEHAEAQEGFLRGSHLLGLLDVQKERLGVWKSRLCEDQLPDKFSSSVDLNPTFPSHRDAMNALYFMLCEIMFEETHITRTSHSKQQEEQQEHHRKNLLGNLAHGICQIAGAIDLTKSNVSDVYTFSLAETFLQLVCLWRSDVIFHYILDILWPRLEMKGKGYEHSHYPTHLVKRIITQIAVYWGRGRLVYLALPAVTEDISKLRLLDINYPVDMVVCGYEIQDDRHFVERISLPS